jgi:hypothetical protein
VDDADVLIALIERAIGGEARALRTALAAARAAQTSAQWSSATQEFRREYRDLVRDRLNRVIPPPILALPGVRDLLLQLLDSALARGGSASTGAAKEVSLGPASASLSLPAVFLSPPASVGGAPALIAFRPPTGLGLEFGEGPVSGGGALDYQPAPAPRLSGVLGLKMGVAQVRALSILEGAEGGYSLVTLLAGRFAPGIQLGFGFAITGMGGLIGINRAADAGALEARFRSGALANALFADDPITNAAATLQALGSVFPVRQGAHLLGPSMQLAWLKVGTFTLFNVDLGIFVQLPGPSRIDIVGSARAGIPLLFQLRLDVRGELDVARRVVGIHAILIDSRVMGIFRLQGEALFRMRYGDDPYVVLTIGGFFPGFNPAPAELPSHIQRLGMALDLPIKLPVYLRAVGYLAVTSNTLQFGAHLEAGFDAAIFSAEGHFSLDALFQFDPFRFDVLFSAGFHVRVLGATFSGVTCSGRITGPGPVVIHARITYRTPFFLPNISWSDTFTLGSSAPQIATTADLFEAMKREVVPANLLAEDGHDPHVSLTARHDDADGFALLSPLGALLWAQRLAPLGLELQRLQNTPLPAPAGVTVTSPGSDPDRPRERFNLGMYRDLSDAERMNLGSQVEEHVAGVRHRFSLRSGPSAPGTIRFDEYRRPEMNRSDSAIVTSHPRVLLERLGDRSVQAQVANLEPKVTMVREEWRAAGRAFDTRGAAHVVAQRTHGVAHLAIDTVDAGGL